jgi:serine/threonine protein kinase
MRDAGGFVGSATTPVSLRPHDVRLSLAGSAPAGAVVDGLHPLHSSDPERIADYVLSGRLGSGGEAIVYRGHNRRTGPVAVKVLRAGGATPPESHACRHEFQMMRRVDRRHVVTPIEAGESSTGPFLVTAYRPEYRNLAGRTRLSSGELWRLASATASAIAAVHAAGVIHCDIKPANVLAYGIDVRLIDFGIARLVDRQPRSATLVRCSRGWSAPEQLVSGPLTPAVDVFGWGCLMGYLAAGATPFASETLEEWVLRVRSAEADLSDLPDGLDDLVRLALRRDPARRPTAAYLAAACRSVNAVTRLAA